MAPAPIFGFNDHKPEILREVITRVTAATRDPVLALNEAAYFEMRRVGAQAAEYAEWRTLAGRCGRMTSAEARERVRALCERHAEDIAGNFDPTVYRFASRAVAPLLGALLAPKLAFWGVGALEGRVVVQGPIPTIRSLAARGTLVFVPTHLSNLDSVVFGFALERSGLPPATYGAGKNLFSNPVLSFFMQNLGAYRVDRRLKHTLYKDVLKAYSCVLIERGYHSLFFPGGTRSRSGGVERHLKLGLAGTALEAFGRTTERGRTQKVFFVPATINYLLTLEAETLIDDFLQEEGKARYIIEDDESTRVSRVAAFLQKLLGLDESVVVRFGSPVDCFGHRVDDDGESHDAHGRRVDPTSYLMGRDGTPRTDAARDAQYTRELGEVLCQAFARDTVVMATHLVAAVAFEKLRAPHSQPDLFTILRPAPTTREREAGRIRRDELVAAVGRLLERVRAFEREGKLVLAPQLVSATGAQVLDQALRAFAGYHTRSVLAAGATDVVLQEPRLLFYYQNRLAAHGLAHKATLDRQREAL